MSELYRCDVCYDLIDPVEGDERNELLLLLRPEDGDNEDEKLDLCESCRPSSIQQHVNWMTVRMEDAK